MSNMDYYLLEKEGENSKCGMLDLGKCIDSDENSTGGNVFATSTSSVEVPPSYADNGKLQGDRDLRKEDESANSERHSETNNPQEQGQVVGSSDDHIMRFITASPDEGSSEVTENKDSQIEKDTSTCESTDSMLKDIIDMNVGVSIQEERKQPVSESGMTVGKDDKKIEHEEPLPDPDHSTSYTTTDEESTKSNISNEVAGDHKKTKSLDDILDHFCDENSDVITSQGSSYSDTSNIITSQGSSYSDTSNTEDKELPVVPANFPEIKKQTFKDNVVGFVERRADIEPRKVYHALHFQQAKRGYEEVQEEEEEVDHEENIREIDPKHIIPEARDTHHEERVQGSKKMLFEENVQGTEAANPRKKVVLVRYDQQVEEREQEMVEIDRETKSQGTDDSEELAEREVETGERDADEEVEALHGSSAGEVEALHGSSAGEVEALHGSTAEEVEALHGSYAEEIEAPHGSSAEVDALHRSSAQVVETLHGSSAVEALHESSAEEIKSKEMYLEKKTKGFKIKRSNLVVKPILLERSDDLITKKRTLADSGENIRKKCKTLTDEEEDSEDIDNDLEDREEMMEDLKETASEEVDNDLEDREELKETASEDADNDLEDRKDIIEELKETARDQKDQLETSEESVEKQRENVVKDSTDLHSLPKLGREAVNGIEHHEEDETSDYMTAAAPDSDAEVSENAAAEFQDHEVTRQSQKTDKEVDLLDSEESTKKVANFSEADVSSAEEEIFEGTPEKVIEGKQQRQAKKTDESPIKIEKGSAKNNATAKEGRENEDDPYIDFDEESIENISRTIRSFSNEKAASKKRETRASSNSQREDSSPSKRVIMVKTAPNVERVKRKLEEILEKSKGEEDAAIAELQRMKKEKTDILNAITTEMEKLKSMLVKEKQG